MLILFSPNTPFVQQTGTLHGTHATLWFLTDCKSPKEAVPYLISYGRNSHRISPWRVLQQWLLVMKHPQEHMVGCLHQQPAEALFLPALCAPVGLEKCHQQPGGRLLTHLTALRRKHLESTLLNENNSEINILWSHEEFDVSLQLIVYSQLSLSRTHRNLSPRLSHQMPLWHEMSCTNQGAGISPGWGFDRLEERSVQSSGWHSAPHRCAWIISRTF